MSVVAFVWAYAAGGGLVAAAYYAVLAYLLRHEQDLCPEEKAEMQALEQMVGGLPGGMITVLATIVLLWPLCVLYTVAEILRGR